MINMAYRPYCTNGLNSLQSFTLVTQFLTLFVGIMILLTKATAVGEEDGGSGGGEGRGGWGGCPGGSWCVRSMR